MNTVTGVSGSIVFSVLTSFVETALGTHIADEIIAIISSAGTIAYIGVKIHMLLQKLQKARAIHPPAWLPNNTVYLTIMGSMAYGVSSDSSDMDLYGFAMPPLDMVFPHLRGEIPGFGRQIPRFEQWQEHRVQSPDSNQLYDFVVYSIVKFFHLCLENNPNLIDSLFTPRRCVVHSTPVECTPFDRTGDGLH